MARILTIDDDQNIRVAIRNLLEQAGHEVIEALDGQEGIDIYTQGQVDLVITDIFLPGKTGLEVIYELTATYPSVKIIAISGVGIRDDIDMISIAKQAGAAQAFEKPLELPILQEAVEILLDKNL